ncbi:MAG: fibrobacter succinogenes major paralogous domain-containing protein [Bacteroidales bacterium]|nr:fibrobacter succinogenes major paralogous domain-containing protein [Bacteroidales bacterium]
MKKFLPPFIVLFFMALSVYTDAQVIDVCAGADSVTLRLGGFQYGEIQWQISYDNEQWEDIEAANDTNYRFMPEFSAYYRAVVAHPNCVADTSEVSHVQLPPLCHAGPDRLLNYGDSYRMKATFDNNALGEWHILSGTGGSLSDQYDPRAVFTGGDTAYTLTWSLTNSCGTTTDTVVIRYTTTEFNNDIVYVDTTDLILSDTAEMVEGKFVIVFSDPVPVVTDSSVIVSLGGEFMRKVLCREMRGDTCIMLTRQGTIDDILLHGVINVDLLLQEIADDTTSGDSSRFVRLNHLPTRAEILADSGKRVFYYNPNSLRDESEGDHLSILKYLTVSDLLGIHLNNPISLNFNFDADVLCSFERNNRNEITSYKIGLSHIEFGLSGGLTFLDGLDVEGQLDLVQLYHLIVSGPVVVKTKFHAPIKVSFHFPLLNFNLSFSAGGRGYLYYDNNHGKPRVEKSWNWFAEKQSTLTTTQFTWGVSFVPEFSSELYGVLGPYINISLPEYKSVNCKSVEYPYGTSNTSIVNIALGFGVKARFLKLFNFDLFKGVLNLYSYTIKTPSKIDIVSGDGQIFTSGTVLNDSLVFKVMDNKSRPVTGAVVHFLSDDGFFNTTVAVSDENGNVSVQFTPIVGNANMATMRACLYDCENEIIDEKTLNAYRGSYYCPNSTLSASFVRRNEVMELRVTGGQPPYQGYISEFTNTWDPYFYAPFIPQQGVIYRGLVRDQYGCQAHAIFVSPSDQCAESDLSVSYYVYSLDGVTNVTLTGEGGTPPYQYQIDGDLSNFQEEPHFSGIAPGDHIAYIKDAAQCIKEVPFPVVQAGDELSFMVYSIHDIAPQSANITCAIISSDAATLDNYGVCWSTSHEPTLQNAHVAGHITNPNSDNFYFYDCEVEGLQPNTDYYARAYITRYGITEYSNERHFTTPLPNAPEVITGSVFNVTKNSATCGGIVTNDHGYPVTARGVCWSTSPIPTLNDSFTQDGSGVGDFTSQISGLTPNTLYWVRAYATNSNGTSYGDVDTFRTLPNLLLTVTTEVPNLVTATTATLHGTAITTGAPIVSRGFCWGQDNNPSIGNPDSQIILGEGSGNSFSATITGLSPSTTYQVSAFADNGQGVELGNVISFTTSSCIPIVNTLEPTAIISNTATLQGHIYNECVTAMPITSCGFCMDTIANPSVGGNQQVYSTEFNQADGDIYYLASNLLTGVTYHVRCYAINANGVHYGDDRTFVIEDDCNLPQVNTLNVANIGTYSATARFTVFSDDGCEITQCGVCWGTQPSLSIDSDTSISMSGSMGENTLNINGLEPESVYYVRAFATNSAGTTYGQIVAFRTDSEIGASCGTVMDADSNVYHTVQLGDQCWMKENLRTTHYADGTEIPLGTFASTTDAYCYYPTGNYDDNVNFRNVNLYGYLYNWLALMHGASTSSTNPSGVQGICPTGWHVPSNAEWTQLVDYLSSDGFQCGSNPTNVSKSLASVNGWNSSTTVCSAGNDPSMNNASGFTAVAGGYNIGSSICSPPGEMAYFWTCTSRSGPVLNNFVYQYSINYSSAEFNSGNGMKNWELSVRCVKN